MFQPACSASQRPGFRLVRGSGDGAVAEITGAVGFGMTAGGGSGGAGTGACAAGAAAGGCCAGCCALSSTAPPSAKVTLRPAASRPLIGEEIPLVIVECPPASFACARSRCPDRPAHRKQTC